VSPLGPDALSPVTATSSRTWAKKRGDMWLRIALATAVALTLAHWVLASRKAHAVDDLKPLRMGETFSIPLIPLHGTAGPPLGCWTGFIVDPGCRGSQHLASAVGSDIASADRANVVWISVAGVAETAEFSATYALPPGRVFTVEAARYVTPVMLSRSLGIGGVPTRVIVDNEWRLRDIELGGAVPADSMFITLCAATPEAGDAN
jgi:hypothetical protein